MAYAALTFWLAVIVLIAWGVHRVWSGLVEARVLNTVLLPGTLVAQLGHVLGQLVTGATVSNTTLYPDGESREPKTTPHPQPRIPVIGPVVIGLLPLAACATAIYFLANAFGRPVLGRHLSDAVSPALPTSLAGVWQLLRDQISLVESMVAALGAADFRRWTTWAFLYLLVCLSVRIAPFPGNLRGALGGILILGVGGATINALFKVADPRVQTAWGVLNLTVATLLFLLLVSLLIRGGVGLIRTLRADA